MGLRISFAAAAALALLVAGSALAGTTVASKTSPFTATYAGRAVVRATSDISADINVTGAGKGNVVGASKLTGIGKGYQGEGCSSFSGTGTITSKLGKLNFTVASGAQACPTEANPDVSALSATAKITGGTGKFKKAKGTLKLTGTYDRGTGRFSSVLKGAVSM